MLRIRSNFLAGNDGEFRYNGELFSGISYNFSEEGVLLDVDAVEHGAIAGKCDDLLKPTASGIRLDCAHLKQTENRSLFSYRGAKFTGVGYLFEDKGQCVAENVYQNGFATEDSMLTWYRSGKPKSVKSEGEYRAWFENGSLKTKHVSGNTLCDVELTYDDKYLFAITATEKNLINLEAIRGLEVGSELFLYGGAVNTKFFDALDDRLDLSSLNHIRLQETGLDVGCFRILRSLENLSVTELNDNEALERSDALWLKKRMPNCAVYFNDELIDSQAA